MKLITDRRDLGLADGLIIFLCVIYFLKRAFIDNAVIQRMDLAVLVLAFLYVVSVLIHNLRTSRKVNMEESDVV